jgi:hypothetical protein
VDSGILVLVPFVGLAVSWLWMALRTRRTLLPEDPQLEILAAALGGLTIYLVSGLFLDLRFFSFLTALFFVLGALVESLYDSSRTSPTRSDLIPL